MNDDDALTRPRRPLDPGPFGCVAWPADALPWAPVAGVEAVVAHTRGTPVLQDFADLGVPFDDSIRRSVASRRRDHLGGRWCAREAMRRLGHPGMPPPGREHGRAPRWADGLCGSLAHTEGVAVALVASTDGWHALGVDVEARMDDAHARHIGPRIAPELPALADPGADGLALTLAFGAKECLYKAAFADVGRMFGFEAAVVTLDAAVGAQAARGTLRIGVVDTLAERLPAGREFDVDWCVHTDADSAQRVFTRLLWARDGG